jgi:hypothetical protein
MPLIAPQLSSFAEKENQGLRWMGSGWSFDRRLFGWGGRSAEYFLRKKKGGEMGKGFLPQPHNREASVHFVVGQITPWLHKSFHRTVLHLRLPCQALCLDKSMEVVWLGCHYFEMLEDTMKYVYGNIHVRPDKESNNCHATYQPNSDSEHIVP